jgi:hypothetical protein
MNTKSDPMQISPNEAEEALSAIQNVAIKTRRSIASGGTFITLIVTGTIWLIGFLCTQFLAGAIIGYIWGGLSILGTLLGVALGFRLGKRVRSPSVAPTAKRIGFFWLLLIFYCVATLAVTRPTDGKQETLLVILFIMIGQLSMGPVIGFSSVWWALPISVLALVGYFLLPAFFYLWMAILGGGGMIAFGLYIRSRW